MSKNLQDFTDFQGFIGHRDPTTGKLEFGDSAQRTFSYFIAQFATGTPVPKDVVKAAYEAIKKPDGELVRHPDITEWYGQRGSMSRDQLIPVLIALDLYGLDKEFKELLWNLLKRGWFAWNTKRIHETEGWKIPDFMGLEGLLIAFRGLGGPFAWCLKFLDRSLKLMVSLRVELSKKDADDVGDDLNLTNLLFHAALKNSTKHAEAAAAMYKAERPGAGADDEHRLEGHPVYTAFQHYYRHWYAPPMDEVFRIPIKEIIR